MLNSFAFAVDGLVHVLHRHRHMRYHFALGVLVLLVSAVMRVTRVELLLLCVGISLVIMAELINSAIEAVVDLVTPVYHPLAKAAKDVGGAVVLVASVTATLIGVGVFLSASGLQALQAGAPRPPVHAPHLILAGMASVVVAVVLAKLWSGHWDLTHGGMASAHSALAFFCFVSIFYLSTNPIVWVLAFLMAALVAQSRVEAGIHSLREVLIGAVVALVCGAIMYLSLPPRGGP